MLPATPSIESRTGVPRRIAWCLAKFLEDRQRQKLHYLRFRHAVVDGGALKDEHAANMQFTDVELKFGSPGYCEWAQNW